MKNSKAAKLLGIAAALLFTCGTHAKELQPVRIGLTSNSFANAGVLVSQIMGLYEGRGLKPAITVAENSAVAMSALIGGSFDTVVIATAEVINANARGQRVVTLSNLYGGLAGTLVLSKAVADRLGVAANAPVSARLKALDGLKIASPSAVSSFTFSYFSAARAAGAKPVPVYVSQPAMVSALQAGAIDGFIASAPFWASPVMNGLGVAWLSGPRGDLGNDFTFSSAGAALMMLKVAEANPEMAKSLALVYQDFAEAVKNKPEEVKAALLKLYPTLNKKDIDVMYDAELFGWTPKPLTKETMAHDIELVKASGMDVPNLDKVDPASMLFP